jgi:pimeloyl-ACP methyl ester carboxylesterase
VRPSLRLSALVALAVAVTAPGAGAAPTRPPLLRVQLEAAAGARLRPHLLLMTLGGPVYCGQLLPLARYLDASLLCPDFGRNGETSGHSRSKRVEDWGDPSYLAAVARLPARLEADGLKVSGLVLVGASYAGYANTELVATHPELHPRALIVVDSFLDLPERYRALPVEHETRAEITRVLGGTLGQRPDAYAARSPSGHLDGLAVAVRAGMQLVDVWSVALAERREFNGATCSPAANAQWLSELASLLGRPVTGYVTRLEHAEALRSWWRELLAFAGLGRPFRALPARAVVFQPGAPVPAGSVCG